MEQQLKCLKIVAARSIYTLNGIFLEKLYQLKIKNIAQTQFMCEIIRTFVLNLADGYTRPHRSRHTLNTAEYTTI